jgi:hypothetical protein
MPQTLAERETFRKVIADGESFRRMIAWRRETGADRWDEVWDGVYVMSPLADNEHQEIGTLIANIIHVLTQTGLGGRVFNGCNVSDQPKIWKKNYRCPDVALFLPTNPAQDRRTFWYGGGPGDRSPEPSGPVVEEAVLLRAGWGPGVLARRPQALAG